MSIQNLLQDNNYNIKAGSISFDNQQQLNDYREGELSLTWTTTNDANTGTFVFKYVKIGKLLTLTIKNGNFVITTPGQLVMANIPSIMYPAKPTGGFDTVNFPMYYLQASGNYTRKLDMCLIINGPEYNDPDPPSAYIQPADVFNVFPNPSAFAAGSYVLQQTNYTYITAN